MSIITQGYGSNLSVTQGYIGATGVIPTPVVHGGGGGGIRSTLPILRWWQRRRNPQAIKQDDTNKKVAEALALSLLLIDLDE